MSVVFSGCLGGGAQVGTIPFGDYHVLLKRADALKAVSRRTETGRVNEASPGTIREAARGGSDNDTRFNSSAV